MAFFGLWSEEIVDGKGKVAGGGPTWRDFCPRRRVPCTLVITQNPSYIRYIMVFLVQRQSRSVQRGCLHQRNDVVNFRYRARLLANNCDDLQTGGRGYMYKQRWIRPQNILYNRRTYRARPRHRRRGRGRPPGARERRRSEAPNKKKNKATMMHICINKQKNS